MNELSNVFGQPQGAQSFDQIQGAYPAESVSVTGRGQ